MSLQDQKRAISMYIITPVRTSADLTAIIDLFTAYAQSLNIDLSFQNFQSEMSTMPGKYTPSLGGELLIARSLSATTDTSDPNAISTRECRLEGEPLGCVALRALPSDINGPSPGVCEMKRLYVSPRARGLGLGRALAKHVIEVAEGLGFTEMRLDTLSTMTAAQAMYLRFGFKDIKPYCFNPVEGTRFLGLKLPSDRCDI